MTTNPHRLDDLLVRKQRDKDQKMSHLSADEIRHGFASAMSVMFRAEVPAYGTLVDMVADINAATLQDIPASSQTFRRQMASTV